MSTLAGVFGWLFAAPTTKRATKRAAARPRHANQAPAGRLEAHPNSPSARFPPTGHPDDQHDGLDGYETWCRGQRGSK